MDKRCRIDLMIPVPNSVKLTQDTGEDVYRFVNKDIQRKTYLYARVSTRKQKIGLTNQVEQLKQWAFMNGYPIHGVFSDIASGISFDNRRFFLFT